MREISQRDGVRLDKAFEFFIKTKFRIGTQFKLFRRENFLGRERQANVAVFEHHHRVTIEGCSYP